MPRLLEANFIVAKVLNLRDHGRASPGVDFFRIFSCQCLQIIEWGQLSVTACRLDNVNTTNVTGPNPLINILEWGVKLFVEDTEQGSSNFLGHSIAPVGVLICLWDGLFTLDYLATFERSHNKILMGKGRCCYSRMRLRLPISLLPDVGCRSKNL
jgi:hypothetical protein